MEHAVVEEIPRSLQIFEDVLRDCIREAVPSGVLDMAAVRRRIERALIEHYRQRILLGEPITEAAAEAAQVMRFLETIVNILME